MKILYIDGSKKNKNLKTLFKIINCLFKNKFTKNSVLISCGGGVIGDVSGLSASLYLRGLNYMHIPTTMTAIVDSCIGGKNGVNFNNLINSLGTYYHPQNVYILKSIIECQPKREYISGIPEIIKCGLIKRSNLLSHIENKNKVLKRDFLFVSKLIKETLNIKIKFFKNDIEEKEERLKLNFGHTFAHAIESTLDNNIKNKKEILRHGEAVGLGLLCEIFYSNGKNKIFYKVRDLLSLYSLPINLKNIDINKNFLIKEIFKFIFYDKKKIGKFPRYINLQKIGNSKIDELRNHERIIQTIENVLFS
jgi:3-dehydroquinate synthase